RVSRGASVPLFPYTTLFRSRLARCRGQTARQGCSEPEAAREVRRERLLLEARAAARPALFQAREPRLSRVGGERRLHPGGEAGGDAALQRADAEIPARGRRARAGAAAGFGARADQELFRPAAALVRTVRGAGGRGGGFPAERDHAAADGDVSQLGLAERLASADPRAQPAVHEPGAG